ncbi:hypothetical protein [Microbacterium gorillae]|uniref:hypothetical protein n=1 Tax=Microbacterium gorillae TaxID=1231063 RepID=UPI00058CA9A1|nr:hypothetical protein [Microbacterium gorillae]
MSVEPGDEFNAYMAMLEWGRENVTATLIDRGWSALDPQLAAERPVTWVWPPTTVDGGIPGGYTDFPGGRIFTRPPRPWTLPTRVSTRDDGWLVEFGRTATLPPAPARTFADPAALLTALEEIEWWPLSVAEAREIQYDRIIASVHAAAYDQFMEGGEITEPYASRLTELRRPDRHGSPASPPWVSRFEGNVNAVRTLIEAEAWASDVRTGRAANGG